MNYFLIISIFFSTTFFLWFIFQMIYQRFLSPGHTVEKRIADYAVGQRAQSSQAPVPFIFRDEQLSNIPFLNRFLEKLSISKQLSNLLERADVKMKAGELILLMFFLGIGGAFIAHFRLSLFVSAFVSLLMAGLPLFYVIYKMNKRLKAFDREFPTAINVLASALKAGHAFNRAIQLVADESNGPVGQEFKQVSEEYALGLPLQEALISLSKRIHSTALNIFVTAVLLQKETGGNLTEILLNIADTIREREKVAGQIRIYSAQGRLSAWVIGLLPIAFVLIISVIHPGYIRPLFTTEAGHKALVYAFCLQMMGAFFIKRITHIKRF